MKKIICMVAFVLMIASVAFAAEMITEANLPELKGTWEGMLGWGIASVANSNAKLEILNDSVPVKARLTLTNVSDAVASRIGLGMSGGMVNVVESDDGQITTEGTLMFVGQAKNFMEFSLRSTKKLNGWYYIRGVKGDMSLSKK